jgi:hypothetical protein
MGDCKRLGLTDGLLRFFGQFIEIHTLGPITCSEGST